MNKYEVTKVKINKDDKSNIKAYVNVVMNDCFAISGVKVIENYKGKLFIGMSSYEDNEGKFHERMYPITKEDRMAFDKAVFDAYEEHLKQLEETKGNTTDITRTAVFLNNREDYPNVLGSANITIGNGMTIKGIRIMQNTETGEIFLNYPSYKRDDGTYKQVCNPISKQFHEDLFNSIMEEYQSEVSKKREVAQEKDSQKLSIENEAAKQSMEPELPL